MSDDRIDNVEAKVAYLEDANETLSGEVAAQLRMIERLESRLALALERIGELESGPSDEPRGDEPPPHY
ncbi:SlyX family protein [Lentisalinibacter salinarum]|uniref:SlyX family protein n=1 Tax=Lentisalinibacter salinarum TaxID=2992239 RepID=UPI00386CBE34